jgi:hypothetical protein
MNHFVTLKKRSDISVARDYAVRARNLVKPNPVAMRPCAFHHCSALSASEKRNGQGLVSVGVGGSEFATMLLKVVILGLLVRESMDWWRIPPAFV